MTIMERIYQAAVVPVVVLNHAEHAIATAQALHEGGIDLMEITMRTDAALSAVSQIRSHCPNVLVGAGTVLDVAQCQQAIDAGAAFIVSPGFSAPIVSWCIEHGVAVLPGCVTPTEIMEGLRFGLNTFKFFPANIYGGLMAMKALSAPFRGVRFVPTGGVSENNLKEYLSAPFIHAVGGSWLCSATDIDAENWDKIKANAARAVEIAATVRRGASA